MSQMKVSAWGMLWFRNAQQYAEYLALFEDAHVLPATYSQWQKRATQAYENILRQGAVAMKIQASPEEFRSWCIEHGHGLNAAGRMAFGSFKAAEKFRQSHPDQENQ